MIEILWMKKLPLASFHSLESQRNQKRRSLFEAQDQIDQQRDQLIETLEGKLAQKTQSTPLFTLRWTVK